MIRDWLGAIALIGTAACAAHAPPPAAAWTPVDAATGRLTAIPDLEALAARFPESALVQRRLLGAAHRAGDSDRVRAVMTQLGELGFAMAPATFEELRMHFRPGEAESLAARAEANRRPIGTSALFSLVPAEHRLVEGVAWDSSRGRLFASSVVSRRLLVLGAHGWSPVPEIEAGSLFGLAVDAPRRLLWAASGTVDPTPSPETAYRGLIAVSLDDLALVRRVPAPAGLSPADISLAPDGTLYASDPLNGAILRLRPGGERMEVLVPPGRLRSPQGIAVAPGGSLYVSDYGYGIAIVDPATGALSRLAADAPMMLDGIDGLLLFEGDLVGIQNGTSPRRIVRMRLDGSGRRVRSLEVLEDGNDEWGEPTLGQLKEGGLVYVADAQWERFGDGGVLNGTEPLRPTAIRWLRLD